MNKSDIQRMQESGDVQGLVGALDDSDACWDAVNALGKVGAPAVEPLIEALKDRGRDPTARRLAGAALGSVGAPATEALTEALTDSDETVRRWAADAFIKIEDPRAVEPLIQALKDESFAVRTAAAKALTPLRDPRAVAPLIEALRNDRENSVQVEAALANMGPPAVEPLCAALQDKNVQVQRGAAFALGGIRDARAVEPLIAMLHERDHWDVRATAANALGKLGDVRAVEPLNQALQDEHGDVRERAAWALRRISERSARPEPPQRPPEKALRKKKWWNI